MWAGDIVAEELGLGQWGGNARADVVTVRPSWSAPVPTIYEVKVTRSDFLKDVRTEKYGKYLPFVSRFYYAIPRQLVSVKDLPEGIGLIQRGPNGWHTLRASRLRNPSCDLEITTVLFAILLKKHPRPGHMGRLERIQALHCYLGPLPLSYVHTAGLQLAADVRRLLAEGQAAITKLARLKEKKAQ